MTAYSRALNARKATPQTQPIPDREEEMVKNNAGGYAFVLSPMDQLRRFLILGSEGNTYYVSEQKMTADNTKNIRAVLNSSQGVDAIAMLADISDKGLAPKVSPALYMLALAFASKNLATKQAARIAFGTVVRTHSHLLEFVSYANELRGWGRMLRETVAHWYNSMSVDNLGYQLAKYRNRSGWTIRDALRMAHPKAEDPAHNDLYKWAVGNEVAISALPNIVRDHMIAMSNAELHDYQAPAAFIRESGLTREMIPNTWLSDPAVWDALLQKMPLTAMIRNLGKMSEVGLITPFSQASKLVVERLNDVEYLRKSRIHPLGVLLAYYTYKTGRGFKGSLTWKPVAPVVDALESAFYNSFVNVEPTGKNTMIAIDVSGSMGGGSIAGTHMVPSQVTAALAMVTARTEPNYMIGGFSTQFVDLKITARDTLASARNKTVSNTFGGTDVSVAIDYARKQNLPVESFLVITDNETWAGRTHPAQALKAYRQASGIDAKLAFMATSATNFSLADPKDSGMLDVVGFDSSVPQILADFFGNKA